MTKLFIKVESGQAMGHPAFEENLVQAYGAVPSDWEPFLRIARPVVGLYEVLDSDVPTYQKIDGVWTDVWALRPMTQEEKSNKQQAAISSFLSRKQAENWSAWIFNEDICAMVPPVTKPAPDKAKADQGIFNLWCGKENNWKDTPPRPNDGSTYEFDFFAWVWVRVEVTNV